MPQPTPQYGQIVLTGSSPSLDMWFRLPFVNHHLDLSASTSMKLVPGSDAAGGPDDRETRPIG
jgi:hypothetical protein